jgi:hypothetical protein
MKKNKFFTFIILLIFTPLCIYVGSGSGNSGGEPEYSIEKAMPWIPLLLLHENQPTFWITLMSEGFEGVFPSGFWHTLGDPRWGVDDYKPHSGSKSAWCARGGPSGVDPMTNDYPNNMDAWMIYGPFDLSDASDAELIFQLWLKSNSENDYFMWLASTDGMNFFGELLSGNTNGWVEKKFDLKSVPTLGNLCGEPEVWIAFIFRSDLSINDEGAFIDSITLRKK